MHATARGKETRLSKNSTTEQLALLPDIPPEWGERRGLPGKVSSLRRKLYQKAKREPKRRRSQWRYRPSYDRKLCSGVR